MRTPGLHGRILGCTLALVTILLAGGHPARGQQGLHWTAIGPGGGTVNSLATVPGQPGTLYAGVYDSGVWKTTDGGATWALVLPLEDEYSIFFLVVAPDDPQVIYAGTGDGTFRSSDGGATWTRATPYGVGMMAISPFQPQVLIGATGGAIFKSWDRGVTWAPVANLAFGVLSMVVDPANSGVLYASGSDLFGKAAFARSDDGGSTWHALATDFFSTVFVVGSITLKPGNPAALYACVGLELDGTGAGIYRSLDGGQSWTKSLPFPAQTGCTLVADPSAPDSLYAGLDLYQTGPSGLVISHGIWKTTDDGASWSQVLDSASQINVLAVDPGAPGRVYAGLQSAAVLASQDGGAHWASAAARLWATSVSQVAVSPTAPGEIYAAAENSVVKSTDGGATWNPTGALPIDGSYLDFYRIAVNPGTAGLVYVADEQGLFRSVDGGDAWQQTSSLGTANDVAIDPTDPSRIYVVGPSLTNDVLQYSDDGGATWSVPPSPPYVLLPPNNYPTPNIEQLLTVAIDPQNPAHLYTGGDFLWTSQDRGQTWTQLFPPVSVLLVRCLRIDPRPPGALYLFGSGNDPGIHAVYKSLDRGQTWIAADSGLPAGAVAQDLQIDSQTSALYLATQLGVFVSMDGGATYSPQSDGLGSFAINALALDPLQPGRLYAGTDRGGVFTTPGTCVAGPQALCLGGGRFRVTVRWTVPGVGSGSGAGTATALSDDAGTFWFFSPDNLELVVKVVDGRPLNAHFWVFYGALTNTAYTLTLTDMVTGVQRIYENSAGALTSAADTSAFADAGSHPTAAIAAVVSEADLMAARRGGRAPGALAATPVQVARPRRGGAARQAAASAAGGAATACRGGVADLCLNGSRFQVQVAWKTPDGRSGVGTALALTGDTGAFWFFDAADLELMIKIVDGRAVNGHFWMIYGSLSNVQFTVTVTDTQTGASRTYTNSAGQLASRADTSAF
ncbi:MAG TPA: hypothetical protein VMW75_23425 [Thermoanaerobaculia bacterium]|nr:hypothetical protein [Thermoanaerobaculia bacterium]